MAERERQKIKLSSSPMQETPESPLLERPPEKPEDKPTVIIEEPKSVIEDLPPNPSSIEDSASSEVLSSDQDRPILENNGSKLSSSPIDKTSPPSPPPISMLEEWLLRYFSPLGVKRDSDLFRYALQLIENLLVNDYQSNFAQIEQWIPAVVHWSVIFLHQGDLLPKLLPLFPSSIKLPSWEMGYFLLNHQFHPEKIGVLQENKAVEDILQIQGEEQLPNVLFIRTAEDIYQEIKTSVAGVEPKLLSTAIITITKHLLKLPDAEIYGDPAVETVIPLVTAILQEKNYIPKVLGDQTTDLPLGAIAHRWDRFWAISKSFLNKKFTLQDLIPLFSRIHSYREFNNYDPELLAFVCLQNLDPEIRFEYDSSKYGTESVTYLNDAIHFALGNKTRPIDSRISLFLELVTNLNDVNEKMTLNDHLGFQVMAPWKTKIPVAEMYNQIHQEAENLLTHLDSNIINNTSLEYILSDLYIAAARTLGYPICNDDLLGGRFDHENTLDLLEKMKYESYMDRMVTPITLNHIIYQEASRIFPTSIPTGAYYLVHYLLRATILDEWTRNPLRNHIQAICNLVKWIFTGNSPKNQKSPNFPELEGKQKLMKRLFPNGYNQKEFSENANLFRFAEKGIQLFFDRFQLQPEYVVELKIRMIHLYFAALTHLPLIAYQDHDSLIFLIEKYILVQAELLPWSALTQIDASITFTRKSVDDILLELNRLEPLSHPYLIMMEEGLRVVIQVEEQLNLEFSRFWQVWSAIIRRIQPQTSHQMLVTVYLTLVTLIHPNVADIPSSLLDELIPPEYHGDLTYYWAYLNHDFPYFVTELERYAPTYQTLLLKVNSK